MTLRVQCLHLCLHLWLRLWLRLRFLVASSVPLRIIRARISLIHNYSSIIGSSTIFRPFENGWHRDTDPSVILDPAGTPYRITGPVFNIQGNIVNALKVKAL